MGVFPYRCARCGAAVKDREKHTAKFGPEHGSFVSEAVRDSLVRRHG